MFPAETVVISPAVHARVRVLGHPELERVIEAPRDAPGGWVISAYLLSIGVERVDVDDRGSGPRLWAEPWNERVQVVDVPELQHPLEITTSYARVPKAGEQQVCVLDDDDGRPPRDVDSRRSATWWEGPPSFQPGPVNRELAQMYGIVLPRFAGTGSFEYGFEFGGGTPVERLLGDLTPTRRLALRAHLDDIGIDQPCTVGREDMVAVTEGIRALLDRFGPDGVAQDKATGWLPWGLLERTVRELGWGGGGAGPELLPQPEEALLMLARKMRLIRRLRGDIVLTNRGHELLREPERCRRELDDVLQSSRRGWSWREQTTAVTLVLLAIADGTIDTVDEVPAVLARGRGLLNRRGFDGFDEFDGLDELGRAVPRRAAQSDFVPREVQDLIGVLAALSPAGGYGSFPPAVRAIARAALR